MLQKAINTLVAKFNENGWKEIEVSMKKYGHKIYITPCYYGDETPKSPEECDFFLMEGSDIYLCGDTTIENVAKKLLEYDRIVEEDRRDKERLSEMYNELEEMEECEEKYEFWSFYSDRFKETWGHRPRYYPKKEVV